MHQQSYQSVVKTALSNINWHAMHAGAVRLVALTCNAYGLFSLYALGQFLHSPILAVGMNGTLMLMNAFFGLFAWLFAGTEPERATFAASGCILSSLMV